MTVFWGILGAGKIAESQMAPAIAAAPGHELVAVMRRELDAAQRFADRHGARRAYDSVEALLSSSEVNAVYVATPPHLHAHQTVLAARAGKHVLCEKPMALTTGEARQMIEASRASGVLLTICHYQRFNARHQRIRSLVEEGAIGQVTAARINFSERFPPQPGIWHHKPEISGGRPADGPGHPLHRPAALSVRSCRIGRGAGGGHWSTTHRWADTADAAVADGQRRTSGSHEPLDNCQP